MATGVSLQLQFHEYGVSRKYRRNISRFKSSDLMCVRQWHFSSFSLSSLRSLQNDNWKFHVANKTSRPLNGVSCRNNLHTCHCCLKTSFSDGLSALKSAAFTLSSGSYNTVKESPLVLQLAPAFGIIAFALWGLGPVMRQIRKLFHKNDKDWVKSRTHYIFTSYFQPLLLWVGASLICRALNPIVLTSAASQTIKQRLLNFVQSFSTVVAVAFCLTSFIQQTQKYYVEKNNSDNARAMGFQFAGKAVYSLVWIAACCLFFELLGFSTHKWVTAGGLGTVLLTLAGREIFTNFLSSIMIHASRPFAPNDWIQAKFDGYEISGNVESVGWWSPTIIRGEDREAIYIPNHKFTVNILRNLTRKTHWRIKTHLAISHLDVNKINYIVADMRKVLSKNPQIEHKRLHRRVFLEEVNLENQALMILISCFVKTAHHEEYLCVKEAVLLDLLKVISHHKARLATPIRTVQKFYTDAVMDYDPFSKSVNRPLLLTDSLNKINGEDKSKLRKSNEEQAPKTTTSSKTQPTVMGPEGTTTQSNSEKQQNTKVDLSDQKSKSSKGMTTTSESQPTTKNQKVEKQQNTKVDSTDHKTKSSKEMTTTSSESKPTIKPNEGITQNNSNNQQKSKVDSSDQKSNSEEMTKPPSNAKLGGNETTENVTPESENSSSISASKPVSVFEENIVLGLAINGAKKTLPVDVVAPSTTEPSEVVASRISLNGPNSASKSNKDSKGPEGLGEIIRMTTINGLSSHRPKYVKFGDLY